MSDDPEGAEDLLSPSLRYLKTLVTVLTATMILGLLTMIVLFVIRLGPQGASELPLPDEITLPNGATALSVTWGARHYVVVTDENEVLIFDLDGTLTKTIGLE